MEICPNDMEFLIRTNPIRTKIMWNSVVSPMGNLDSFRYITLFLSKQGDELCIHQKKKKKENVICILMQIFHQSSYKFIMIRRNININVITLS